MLVDVGDRHSAGDRRQIQRQRRLRHAQTRRLIRLKHYTALRGYIIVIAVHPHQFGTRSHICTDGVDIQLHRCLMLPGFDERRVRQTYLERVLDHLVVELLEAHIRVREPVFVARTEFAQELSRSLVVSRADHELRIVGRRHSRRIGSMETRRGVSDKRGDSQHTAVSHQHTRQAVSQSGSLIDSGTLRQVDLDSKHLTFGLRQELQVQAGEEEHTRAQRRNQQTIGEPATAEAEQQQAVVRTLQPGEEQLLNFLKPRGTLATATDKLRGEIRCHPCGVEDTGTQRKQHREREELHKLAQRSGDDLGHREEHTRNGAGSQTHRHEQLPRADRSRVPTRPTAVQQVGISVDNNHRVVHDHTQHKDQCRQGDRVQFDTGEVHQSDTDGYAHRHTGTSHQRRTQRKEQKHHGNHHKDGYEYIPEERAYAVVHNLRLIGDAVQTYVGRKLQGSLIEHLLHRLAKGNDVVAGLHLHAYNQTGFA